MRTITDAFLRHAASTPDRTAWRTMDGGTLSWAQWSLTAQQVAGALQASGINPGDRVAVLAGNSMVWPLADMGVQLAGGVSVGLYPTSSVAQVAEVMRDCGARVLIVDGAEQLAKATQAREECPDVHEVVAWRGAAVGVSSWDAWLARSTPMAPVARAPHDDAVLIYTSGSTGVPKGARISHECLVASAQSVIEVLGLTSEDTSLSYLPFCHAAERMFGYATRVWLGMEALMVDDIARVFEAAASYNPTVFGGLPRFYEKAYEAMRVAEGTGPDAAANAQASRVAHFGTRLRRATSGGAALPTAVATYLDAHGVRVLGAYGQTEHLCVAMHRPDHFNFTSVGLPMPGTELRIADDGEVLVKRSALTFSGYWQRDEDTREAFTADGTWLRTGDLGSVDDDGFLTITGRKKEIIALSSGKKVAPLPIEAELTAGAWIEHAVLFGEGRRFVTALITLREATLRDWAARAGVTGSLEALAQHHEVQAAVQAQVDAVNARLSRPEQVKKWVVLSGAFSVAGGELTPTMKLKRREVTARYAAVIEPLYD